MRNSIILIIAATAVLFAAPSHAGGKASKQESIGVGSGAVIGAIAGGPVGLIVGAAVGAKIGDTMHQKTTVLASDVRKSGRWEALFTEEEINEFAAALNGEDWFKEVASFD